MNERPREPHQGPPLGVRMRAGVGFRFRRATGDTKPAAMARLAAFEVADISDMTNRLSVVSAHIRPMAGPPKIVGTACTVRVALGDNLMLQKALDLVEPGQVIMVDASGSEHYAVMGELIALKARERGAAGVIVDGLIRDVAELAHVGLPVFARGVTANGPTKYGPGEVNYPICCGGIVVHPGDIVLADTDGVLVLSQDDADEVAHAVETRAAEVKSYREKLRQGVFSQSWIDRILDDYPGIDKS